MKEWKRNWMPPPGSSTQGAHSSASSWGLRVHRDSLGFKVSGFRV